MISLNVICRKTFFSIAEKNNSTLSFSLLLKCLVLCVTTILFVENAKAQSDVNGSMSKNFEDSFNLLIKSRIEINDANSYIVLSFQNIDSTSLMINSPQCWINSRFRLTNNKKEEVPMKFKVKVGPCAEEKILIEKGAVKSFRFKYTIEEMYDMDENEEYELEVIYAGSVCDKYGKIIKTNEERISNKIAFKR